MSAPREDKQSCVNIRLPPFLDGFLFSAPFYLFHNICEPHILGINYFTKQDCASGILSAHWKEFSIIIFRIRMVCSRNPECSSSENGFKLTL